MNIPITARSRNIPLDSECRLAIEGFVALSLTHYDRVLQRVRVDLYDENGPRGGIDTRCRIDIELTTGGGFSVASSEGTCTQAVDTATARARRRLDRMVVGARSQMRRGSRRPSPERPSAA